MDKSSKAIADHVEATKALIHDALTNLQAVNPEAAQAAGQAEKSGAYFQTTTCISSAGMREVRIALVFPDGETLTVADVDYQQQARH